MKKLKTILLIGVLLLIAGIIVVFLINIYILKTSENYIFQEIRDLPQTQAALVLGAMVYSNGEMSDIFADRVITARELYSAGKVDKLIISGDHGQNGYDEVNVAKEYLLKNEVAPQDIFLDHAGFDTYDSIYRAKEIFQIESMVVVTQEFHVPRAVYIGNALNIETYGYIADRQEYLAASYNFLRESLARIKAFLNVIFHSSPKYSGKEIPITGDGRLSWD
jgi:SanA protein